jgi:hypothetical protein
MKPSHLFHSKVKVKGAPAHVMKAFKWSRSTALHILNIIGRRSSLSALRSYSWNLLSSHVKNHLATWMYEKTPSIFGLCHIGNRFIRNDSMYIGITSQKTISFIATVVRKPNVAVHTNLWGSSLVLVQLWNLDITNRNSDIKATPLSLYKCS